jgi:feruloyl-CoA synthase
VLPDIEACRTLAEGVTDPAAVLAHPAVRAVFADRLSIMAKAATGSSNLVRRIALEAEPPSLDAGEITDKGSLNQRAVLKRRAATVDALYADAPASPSIISV